MLFTIIKPLQYYNEFYSNLTAQSSQKVAKQVSFYPINDHLGIKIDTLGAAKKIIPIYAHKFNFTMPTKVTDAKTYYNYKNNTAKLMTISDKLRSYKLQNGLEQKDVAKIIGINRSDYIGYENNSRNYYPAEIMDKLAKLYQVNVYDLLDDYNTLLYNGQYIYNIFVVMLWKI